MKILDCEQGSPEWEEARRGIPTASEFSSIITPKTGKLSAGADAYIARLIAESVVVEDGWAGNAWTDRGKIMEREACAWYAFNFDIEVRHVGIILNKGAGYSPDGLCDNGAIEAKCPKASSHVVWLMRGTLPDEHKVQCHAGLCIGELEWLDFVSYHPDFEPFVVRVYPDEYTEKVDAALSSFLERYEDAKAKIHSH